MSVRAIGPRSWSTTGSVAVIATSLLEKLEKAAPRMAMSTSGTANIKMSADLSLESSSRSFAATAHILPSMFVSPTCNR
jgi:hypothetical protein